MNDTTKQALVGAAAGLAGTAPMTVFMELAHRQLPFHQRHALPPRRVTLWAAETAGAGEQLDESSLKAATMAAHFGYGAGAGAIYGLVEEKIPLPPVAKGMAFGFAVWAASYLGWIPAAGVLPPATREYAGRNAVMIGAHLVWGGVLGFLASRAANHRAQVDRPNRSPANVEHGRPLEKYVAASHQNASTAKW